MNIEFLDFTALDYTQRRAQRLRRLHPTGWAAWVRWVSSSLRRSPVTLFAGHPDRGIKPIFQLEHPGCSARQNARAL